MQCQKQHLGVSYDREVAQSGEEQAPLEGMQLLERRRRRSDRPPEQVGLFRLGDVTTRGVHDRDLVSTGAEGGHDLHGRSQGDVPFGRGAAGQNRDPHLSGCRSAAAGRRTG